MSEGTLRAIHMATLDGLGVQMPWEGVKGTVGGGGGGGANQNDNYKWDINQRLKWIGKRSNYWYTYHNRVFQRHRGSLQAVQGWKPAKMNVVVG